MLLKVHELPLDYYMSIKSSHIDGKFVSKTKRIQFISYLLRVRTESLHFGSAEILHRITDFHGCFCRRMFQDEVRNENYIETIKDFLESRNVDIEMTDNQGHTVA